MSTTARTISGGLGVRYELKKELGRGAFGVVYEATDAAGLKWACKIVEKARLDDAKKEAQMAREIATMKKLDHPHIVKQREVLETGNRFYIIMELITGGTLLPLVDSSGGTFKHIPEAEAMRYFRQITSALRFCHDNNVAHRDIKLENVMLCDGECKITDFGLANFQGGEHRSVLSSRVGTPAYVAPEVVTQASYDGFAADVFSTGAVLFALLTGQFPPRDRYRQVQFDSQVAAVTQHLAPETVELMQLLMHPDPAVRLRTFRGEEHPWLRGLSDGIRGTVCEAEASAFDPGTEDEVLRCSCAIALPAPLPAPKLAALVDRLGHAGLSVVDKHNLAGWANDTPLRAMKKSAGGRIVSVFVQLSETRERDSVKIDHERGGTCVDFTEVVAEIARAVAQ